jgi:ribonuclease-3
VGAGSAPPSEGGAERDRAKLLAALDAPLSAGLLERALTHRSYAYENGGLPTNERLEFLGDSVLGLIVTDTLFREHPDLPEGQLAKLRAAVVQMRALAGVARELNLGAYIRLGRGEEGTGGRDKPSILADTLEAVIGAVYLDRGLAAAGELVHRLFDPVIANSAQLGAGLDWKTSLQELTAAEFLGVPDYRVEESGPDHQKSFRATVRVGGRAYGSGAGKSKKEAEQQAAEAAYTAISAEALRRAEQGSQPAAPVAAAATGSAAGPASSPPDDPGFAVPPASSASADATLAARPAPASPGNAGSAARPASAPPGDAGSAAHPVRNPGNPAAADPLPSQRGAGAQHARRD